MTRKGLVSPSYGPDGVRYEATELAPAFLAYFESSYATAMAERARWLNNTFGTLTYADLRAAVDANLGKWGTEFVTEPDLEEEASV
jgi:hypothetical protein